jgi:hypothetical protein
VGLEIPPEVQWLSWIVGSDWPEGDETAMRRCAVAWHQAASDINELIPELERSAANVLSSVQGAAADSFAQYWEQFVATDPQFIPKLVELCENLARQVEQGALDIEYAKYMFIALLIITAIEIAMLIASAFATFGASTAAIPAVEAAAQITARTIFQRLLIAIAKHAAIGALQGVGLDVLIQGIQIAKGDRDGLDLRKTALAGMDGAIGGAISGGVGHGLGHVPGLRGTADSAVGNMFQGAARGALAEGVSGVAGTAATAAVHGDPITLESLAKGGTSGAFGGSVGGARDGLNSYGAGSGPGAPGGLDGGTGTGLPGVDPVPDFTSAAGLSDNGSPGGTPGGGSPGGGSLDGGSPGGGSADGGSADGGSPGGGASSTAGGGSGGGSSTHTGGGSSGGGGSTSHTGGATTTVSYSDGGSSSPAPSSSAGGSSGGSASSGGGSYNQVTTALSGDAQSHGSAPVGGQPAGGGGGGLQPSEMGDSGSGRGGGASGGGASAGGASPGGGTYGGSAGGASPGQVGGTPGGSGGGTVPPGAASGHGATAPAGPRAHPSPAAPVDGTQGDATPRTTDPGTAQSGSRPDGSYAEPGLRTAEPARTVSGAPAADVPVPSGAGTETAQQDGAVTSSGDDGPDADAAAPEGTEDTPGTAAAAHGGGAPGAAVFMAPPMAPVMGGPGGGMGPQPHRGASPGGAGARLTFDSPDPPPVESLISGPRAEPEAPAADPSADATAADQATADPASADQPAAADGVRPGDGEVIPPGLPDHLHDVYGSSEATPAGRSLYGPDEQNMRDLAQRVQADPAQYVLDGHGTPDGIRVGDRPLNVQDVADIIRNDPNWNGREVLLLSCDAGREGAAFASALAGELGVPVVAPDGLAWSDSQGRVFSTSAAGPPGPDGSRRPTWPPDGDWNTFRPDGSRHPVGDRGFAPGRPADTATAVVTPPEDAAARGDGGDGGDNGPRAPDDDDAGRPPDPTATPGPGPGPDLSAPADLNADARAAVTERIGEVSPELASVIAGLLDDPHALNLTEALRNPATRDGVIDVIRGLAAGDALRPYGGDLAAFLRDNPGAGPLFDPIAADVNNDADGNSRKQTYVAEAKQHDEAWQVGRDPAPEQVAQVEDYQRRLKNDVEPAVRAELTRLLDDLRESFGDQFSSSVRTKDAAGLLDKVDRMTAGREGAPGRPDYQVGDVIDAVGARITVTDMNALGIVYERIQQALGTGDGGRILEIENMYADPKAKKPEYRVIPMLISIEVDGQAYTYELQLTTQRASIAADIEHNSIYKPYIPVSEPQVDAVLRAMAEAAALDQLETLGGQNG